MISMSNVKSTWCTFFGDILAIPKKKKTEYLLIIYLFLSKNIKGSCVFDCVPGKHLGCENVTNILIVVGIGSDFTINHWKQLDFPN